MFVDCVDSGRLGNIRTPSFPCTSDTVCGEAHTTNFACRARQSWLLSRSASMVPDMGPAPGGRMKQEIYEDPYGLDAWDQRHPSRCFVAIVNPAQLKSVAAHSHAKEKTPLPDNDALQIKHVVSLRRSTSREVRESSESRPME